MIRNDLMYYFVFLLGIFNHLLCLFPYLYHILLVKFCFDLHFKSFLIDSILLTYECILFFRNFKKKSTELGAHHSREHVLAVSHSGSLFGSCKLHLGGWHDLGMLSSKVMARVVSMGSYKSFNSDLGHGIDPLESSSSSFISIFIVVLHLSPYLGWERFHPSPVVSPPPSHLGWEGFPYERTHSLRRRRGYGGHPPS